MPIPDIDFSRLSVAERVELISRIFDSLGENDVPDSAEMREEIARRIADADSDPDGGVDAFDHLGDLRRRIG